ncbi:MAG: hypothetical protein ABSB22_01650 [Thermodesulfobacteriota bacterium]|jgi:hypothetical protein
MADTKYSQYVIRKPIDYGDKIYYDIGYYGPNVWYKGEDYKNDFTMIFVRVEESMIMEEYSHVHDFDMYLWLLPLEPNNMEDLGCEVELVFGSGGEEEKHVLTKTGSFFVPKGIVHGPFTFRNVTKPVLLVHACTGAADYYKTEVFK